jgi:hypothetical protein
MKNLLLTTASKLPQHPSSPGVEPEALNVKEAAVKAGVSRTLLYEALSPELAARRGWPVLPSIVLGGRRLIRVEALRAWLASLETRAA